MCASLRIQEKAHPELSAVFANKVLQNEALRRSAKTLVDSAPVPAGTYLFGEKPSAADERSGGISGPPSDDRGVGFGLHPSGSHRMV